MGWLDKVWDWVGDTASVVVEGTWDEVTNWFDDKDDEFGQGWQQAAANTDTYGDLAIDSDGDGRADAWDFDGDGMTKEQATEKAFEPTALEKEYAQTQKEEFKYWQDNYLPLYKQAADYYRGGDFSKMRKKANELTDRQFGAAETSALNTAKGFGVDADIDRTKWDAMKAQSKAGNEQTYKIGFNPDQVEEDK